MLFTEMGWVLGNGLPKMEEAIHIDIGLAIGLIIKRCKIFVTTFDLMRFFRLTTHQLFMGCIRYHPN